MLAGDMGGGEGMGKIIKTNFDKICSDIESAADIIMNIGEIASVAWTKEQLIEWLESDIEQDGD